MLCALIMAGGKGTRFWPLSTEEKPKQFLSLLSDDTMLQMTVKRIESLIPRDRIFISTGVKYIDMVKEQLPDLPERNIIIEPDGRNTAPCIALSAFVIKRYYENATIAVLPSDHLIREEEKFLNILRQANDFINDFPKAIVTLGMKPNRPETGYGYINVGELEQGSNIIYKVNKFVEKPNFEKAKAYFESGEYLWNGGMFIWKAENVVNLTKEYLPFTYKALNFIETIGEAELQSTINDNYSKTDNISVDYGIMERAEDIYVIKCDFGWDDVGNWTSIERYSDKDTLGNVFNADGYPFKSNNNIVLTNKKILLNNVHNLIIVETEEYIMISSKTHEQDIKLAKELL